MLRRALPKSRFANRRCAEIRRPDAAASIFLLETDHGERSADEPIAAFLPPALAAFEQPACGLQDTRRRYRPLPCQGARHSDHGGRIRSLPALLPDRLFGR